MFTQFSFFLLLLAATVLLLSYKTASRHLPILLRPWWSYRFTMVAACIASWVFIYQESWGQSLALFLFDCLLFILVRRGSFPKWTGVTLTLLPLLLVKTGVLPFMSILGLSFATFRAIDALLMSDPADSADIGEYFLYLFFPPALLAGPMYRWRDYRNQLSLAYENLSLATALDGWEYLILGMVQKFALAQLVDVCVLQRVSPADYSLSGVMANAVGYSVFLYFDFAGYSNMAIGASRIFGFTLPDNFKNPIATSNPPDFWKRWHVSLSEWLRDVVFSPLYKYLLSKGGFAERKVLAQDVCILATLMIMATWNGIEPHYLASGLLFGLYSVVYNEMTNAAKRTPALKALFARTDLRLAGRGLTLLLAIIALYMFSGRSPLE